jgi:hypothetical protein
VVADLVRDTELLLGWETKIPPSGGVLGENDSLTKREC